MTHPEFKALMIRLGELRFRWPPTEIASQVRFWWPSFARLDCDTVNKFVTEAIANQREWPDVGTILAKSQPARTYTVAVPEEPVVPLTEEELRKALGGARKFMPSQVARLEKELAERFPAGGDRE